MTQLETWEQKVLEQLRAEANSVKDCFTRYSFQGIAISGVMLGIVARLQVDHEVMGFLSVVPIVLLLAVASIGTYKYGTANRLSGYELHLQRTARLSDHGSRWKQHMRHVGWEEAMRSWRVVMATVYEFLYREARPGWLGRFRNKVLWRLRPERIRNQVLTQIATNADMWFEPKQLFGSVGASYHAGGYLQTMLNVIYVITIGSLVPLVMLPIQTGGRIFALGSEGKPYGHLVVQLVLGCLVAFISILLTWLRIRHLSQRRKLLEKGLFSIHSTAIIWQAVITAHFRALEHLVLKGNTSVRTYSGYTREIALQALPLRDNLFDIHEWITRGPPRLDVPDSVAAGGLLAVTYTNPSLTGYTMTIELTDGRSHRASFPVVLNQSGQGTGTWQVPTTGWNELYVSTFDSKSETVAVI